MRGTSSQLLETDDCAGHFLCPSAPNACRVGDAPPCPASFLSPFHSEGSSRPRSLLFSPPSLPSLGAVRGRRVSVAWGAVAEVAWLCSGVLGSPGTRRLGPAPTMFLAPGAW